MRGKTSDTVNLVNRALNAQGMTMDDLAAALGVRRQHLANIFCGNSQSRRTQQAITNICRVKIWKEFEVLERIVLLPAGTIVILPSDQAGAQFERDAGKLPPLEIRKNIVRLLADSKLQITISHPPTERR